MFWVRVRFEILVAAKVRGRAKDRVRDEVRATS